MARRKEPQFGDALSEGPSNQPLGERPAGLTIAL
jgi:hypothetical protein